jgi:hypothetical protein
MRLSRARPPLEKTVSSPLRRARSPLSWLIVSPQSWWLAPADARLIHLFDRGCNFGRWNPV